MSWEAVIGQERVKQALRSGLRKERVPHAYLFFGPYGVGKRAAALTFAKALQCESGVEEPCDRCANCTRIDRMMHPDVRFFLPVTTLTTEADVAERINQLGSDPYATVDFMRRPKSGGVTRQTFYPVSVIRESRKPDSSIFTGDIKRIIDFKSFEGRYKVIVITGAEFMNEQAGNAFLKILEEPTDDTILVLTAERPDRLLPTILSRCQPVRFDPLSREEIEQALITRENLTVEFAELMARLADGSYSTALDLIHDEELREFRERILPFMRAVYANDTYDVLTRIDAVAAQSLDHVKLFLNLLIAWIRDLVLVRELGPDAPVVNHDGREYLIKFCANLQDARLDQMAELVEEAVALVSRNVRAQLVLTGLAAGLRRSMFGKTALPLTTPLADQLLSEVK